jgi:hypothetical protein
LPIRTSQSRRPASAVTVPLLNMLTQFELCRKSRDFLTQDAKQRLLLEIIGIT